MSMRTIDTVLPESPLFEGLAPDQLALIAGCAKNVRFGAGEQLFREGEAADTFFLVRFGVVAIETWVPGRGAVRIETIEPGEVVGWSSLIPPYRYHFDARALDLVRAVAFDGACLREKCHDDHDLGYPLIRRFSEVLAERLQVTRLRLLDVYGDLPVS
jgi:CRP-like cAMP-binding protein